MRKLGETKEKGFEHPAKTVYFGSAKSEVRFRIYDKAQERGGLGYHWVRFEMQLRRERAFNFLVSELVLGERFCGVSDLGYRLKEFDYLLTLPAEVVGKSHSGMGTAVAHGYKNVILAQLYRGAEYPLAAYLHFGHGVIVIFAAAQKYDRRIVVLDDLGVGAVFDMDDGKGGIRHTAHRAYRQRGGYRFNAVLNGKSLSHHGGDYL